MVALQKDTRGIANHLNSENVSHTPVNAENRLRLLQALLLRAVA